MITSIQKIMLATLLLTMIGFTACDDDNGTGTPDDFNVMETIESEDDLSTLYDHLSDESWADTLSQDNPVTVFAPSDNALSEAGFDTLTAEEKTALLKYYVVAENLTYNDLKEKESATTLNEQSLSFTTDGDSVTINTDQATITSNGIEATNGTVFVIDTTLSAD